MKRSHTSFAKLAALVSAVVMSFLAVTHADTPQVKTEMPARIEKWSKDALDAAAHIPIQDGGRVKPLDTFAQFTLLELSGKRSVKVALDGKDQNLSALEWLLDSMFFPRQAAEYPVFLVEDYDVLSDVGIKIDGLKKRDRYTYAFLATNASRLYANATEYSDIEEKNKQAIDKTEEKPLTPVQKQVIRLAMLVRQYEDISYVLQPGREAVDLETTHPALASEFPGRKTVPLGDFVERLPALVSRYQSVDAAGDPQKPSPEMQQLASVLSDLQSYAQANINLRVLPSPAGDEDWFNPSQIVRHAFVSTEGVEPQVAALRTLFAIVPSAIRTVDPAAIEKGLEDFSAATRALADARGQNGKIDLEVTYYKAQFFSIAQWTFVAALMLACLMWLAPRFKANYGAVWLLTLVPWLVLVAGIVVRCILRGRPPVSTLYESILFITAIVVFAAMVMEYISRQRIALFVATIAGTMGLFLAGWYEEIGRTDTMPQLEAVLDTNFWLSTHVTCVTIGYAAGFLAAAVAHVYLFGKIFGLKRAEPAFYRNLSRMIYGGVGFSVVFSTVGTILGGVWANDSWGRFWGWDPKENGALMIVLMNLILLHARLGGFIREFGLALGGIVLSIVVTFSWFHTNQLGIGLHAYGFDENIRNLVWGTYATEFVVLVAGCIAWFFERNRNRVVPVDTAIPVRNARPAAARR